jgi:hypothetical protein
LTTFAYSHLPQKSGKNLRTLTYSADIW